VRRLNEQLQLRREPGTVKPVIGDFFPALDDDGGLLVALTPRTARLSAGAGGAEAMELAANRRRG
jgi:hypothetical protein